MVLGQECDACAKLEGDGLEQCPRDMTPRVPKRQPDQRSARGGLPASGTRAHEERKRHETVRAGGDRCCTLLQHCAVGTGQIAEPVEHGSAT